MQQMVADLVYQVMEYRQHGFVVLGVVGINGSPTCAVERTWYDDAPREGPGIFIQMLQASLAERGISLPMRGIRAQEPEQAVNTVAALLV